MANVINANAKAPGPSYDELVKLIQETVSRLTEKACAIERKFVPIGFIRPKDESEKTGDDSVFGELVSINMDLQEVDNILNSITGCF